MQIRTINWPDDREKILEHIRLVHGPGDSDLLEKWYGSMPGFDPADCFVIDGDNGEIAAHTMLIPRFVQFGDSVLPASEIGVVGTMEQYRSRGYASALMEQSIERMNERGDAVSLIFGIPNFYEKWGYQYALGLYLTSFESNIETELARKAGEWNMAHSHQRRVASQLGIRGIDVTVRSFDLKDLPAVMLLYQQASTQGFSVIARDEATWRWQLDYMADIGRYDSDDFLIAEYEGTILAYMRIVSSAPVNWFRQDEATRYSIIEFAGTDPDATEALLAEAASGAHTYNADRIGLYVHPQSQIMTHALVRGAVQRNFTGAGFLRLNDLVTTLHGMADTFQARLNESPFNGQSIVLRLSTENAAADLPLLPESEGAEIVELEAPAAEMIGLFSGWYGIDNLPDANHALKHYHILNALFPKGDPKVGFADLI